jgi:RimJ/RimL family protein N-acetyltransferase
VTQIRLIPFGPQHLQAVAELVHDPLTLRHTRIPEPPPPDFVEQWYARYEAARRDGTREAFAIEDETGSVLGIALAPEIDRATRTVELGYMVAPEARGRGVATEALRLATEWAFSELGAERIELLIAVDNPGSKLVAERCGYHREGVLRSVFLKQGVRRDMEIWSRLPTD